jgi:hypothetical protein
MATWGRRLSPSHALWLGPDGLWDHGPMPGWRPWSASQAGVTAPQRHASFDAWCQARPGHGCQLVLSGWLLHELLLDPQLPLSDDTARLAYARGLMQHYHGDAALQWPLASWQAGGRHGVSALHALTLADLHACARPAGVPLRRVRPWWSMAMTMAWQQVPALARAATGRLLVVDGALVTQIELARGQVQQLLQRRLADTQPGSLQAWHAAQPPVSCSVAVGHGLASPWPAGADNSLLAIGTLQGDAPAVLWAQAASPVAMAA